MLLSSRWLIIKIVYWGITRSAIVNIFDSAFSSNHRTVKVSSGLRVEEIENLDWNNTLVFVNGSEQNKNYVIKENDSVVLRRFPTDSNDNLKTSWNRNFLSTALGWVFFPVTSLAIDIATGGDYGGAINYFGERISAEMEQQSSSSSSSITDTSNTEKIPTISGAKNKNGAGCVIPLLLGESMYTPITLAQSYTDIDPSDGTDGENQYFHGLYCLGYKDIDLKSVSLGIFELSADEHNGTSGVINTDNVSPEVHTYEKTLSINNCRAEYKKTTIRIPINYDGFETLQIDSITSIDIWVREFDPEPPSWGWGDDTYHFTTVREQNIRIDGKYLVFDIGSFGYYHYQDAFYPYDYTDCQYRQFEITRGTIVFNVDLIGNFSTMHYPKTDTSTSKGYHQQLEIQQGANEVALYPQKVVQENHGTEMMHPEGVDPLYILPFSAKYPQKIQLELMFQNLAHFNDDGSRGSASVDICIGYSLDGGETYLPFNSFQQSSSAVTVSDLGTVTREEGTFRKVRFSGYKNKAMRFIAEKTFSFNEVFNVEDTVRLKNNIVEFKIFRDSVDYSVTDSKYQYKVYFNSIRTWCYDYKKTLEQYLDDGTEELVPQVPIIEKYRDMTARLGFTIRNGQEIQGTLKELNVIMMSRARYCTITEENGEKTYTWSSLNDTIPTNNPASLALMVLQHPMRGEFVYSDDELDMVSFGKFYEWCEQKDQFFLNSDGKKFTANGVVSKQFKTIDLVNQILNCGHGKLVINGNKYAVIYDHEMNEPVMVLNNQNVLSAKNTKNFNEDIDGYSCKFIDSLNDYQEDTQIFVPKELTDPESPKYKDPSEYKLESIEVPWVTDAGRAYRMCMYKLACRKLRPEAWEVKMSVDGALIDVGSLVTYQSDTLVVGIGDGAEIVDVTIDNGVIVSITCDYGFNVTDITKTYGVKIQHSDSLNGVSVITYALLAFERVGEHKVLYFSRPIAVSDIIKPAVGDIVSFGIYEKETTDAICTSKKENNDGTYSLCLIPYQKEVYDDSYESIPEFVTNVTSPLEAGVEVSEETPAPTFEDIGDIASAVVNEGSDEPPTTPSVFNVTPKENWIELRCIQNGSLLSDTVKYFEYEITRANGSIELIKSSSNSFDYVFKRDITLDYYPEKGDLVNWTFRVRVRNIYDIVSEWKVGTLDLSDYGTWIIPQVVVSTEVVDRTAILTAVYEGSQKVYGKIRTQVRIKRKGNTDPVGDSTFNDILAIEEDEGFYTPEFNANVQVDDSDDNEPNYRKDTTTAFVSESNKITHTLPLIGQTARIFKEGNVPVLDEHEKSVFTKDVEDSAEIPLNPNEGYIFHYTGDDVTGFVNDGYYLFENNHWTTVYSRMLIVPTIYEYEVSMINELGTPSVADPIYVKALCTNIADIVHSHEHYKNLYVEKLSAINANIGLITQGGFGSFQDMLNYWALSDLTASESGVVGGVEKGSFRVGGTEQYFKVSPDPEHKGEYLIELRAGNISLSSGTDATFNKGTYIFEKDPDHALKRLSLTPNGIIAQSRESTATDLWTDLAKVIIDGFGNCIISNSPDNMRIGEKVEEGDIYHFDDVATNAESGDNPQNIACSGRIVPTSELNPILSPDSSPRAFEGIVTKDIQDYEGHIIFFSTADGFVSNTKNVWLDGSGVTDTTEAYNDALSDEINQTTLGELLGFTSEQIASGIFKDMEE